MRRKILIVDDEIQLRDMLKEELEDAGYKVETADNGQAGLDKLKSYSPDLIILDIRMPVMDGYEFFKKIKENPEYSEILVLMLTERQGMKETFEMLKVDGFISKPFRTEDLILKIEFLIVKRVLVVTDYDFVSDKVTDAFNHFDYKVDTAKDKSGMEVRLKSARYKYVIVHLACIDDLPIDFVTDMKGLGYETSTIIVYSDSNVPGLSDSSLAPIEQARITWGKAGVKKFYDARLEIDNFSETLKGWLAAA